MFSQVIIVMDARPTPRAEKNIQDRMAEKKCVCGCGRPQWKRGLARVCYYAWQKNRAALPDEKAKAAYDASLIRRGLLLMAQAVRKYANPTVFARAASEALKRD